MANISITNPSIANSETADITKLTTNDNDLVNGLTDGTKDISVSAITAAGLITANGGIATAATGDDVYSVAWTDYFSTSTKTGWSGSPTGFIYYKKIGFFVFILFSISGTSNATTTKFTVPHTPADLIEAYGYGTDNGGSANLCSIETNASATIDLFYTSAQSVWTNSGTKTVRGQFFYRTTT